MTLFSTTRCWRNAFILATASAKYHVRQNILRKASSINFRRSVQYGLGVVGTTLRFALQRAGIGHSAIFSPEGKTLEYGSEIYYNGGARAATQRN